MLKTSRYSEAPTGSDQVTYAQLWSLGGLSFREFVIQSVQGFLRLQLSARSVALAHYALFSTAPLLILILAVSALLPIEQFLETTLKAVEAGMPANIVSLIRKQISGMEGSINVTLTVGSAFLLMTTGSRLFRTFGQGLDGAYGVDAPRKFFAARLISLLMVFLLLVLLLVTMVALVFGPPIMRYLLRELQLEWLQSPTYLLARWGLQAGFMLVASSLLYWIVPSVKVGYYLVSPGSLVATVGSVAATIGLGIYVDSFHRFNEIYGTLGGIAALLIWFHLTGVFLLTGGLINGTIHQSIIGKATIDQETAN